MATKNRLLAILGSVAIATVGHTDGGGTGCPDSSSYRVQNGLCVYSGCLLIPGDGYYASNFTFTCQSSRTTINASGYPNAAGQFENGCDEFVYVSCGKGHRPHFRRDRGEQHDYAM